MKTVWWGRLGFAGWLLCCAAGSAAAEQSAGQRYLALVDRGIAASRSQIPRMTASAIEAAKRVAGGGGIFAAGRRKEFAIEAYVRAGGLMCVKLLGRREPAAGDVVLYGAGGRLRTEDLKKVRRWQKGGAEVVVFGSRPSGVKQGGLPAVLIESGPSEGLKVVAGGSPKLCPADTLMEVINLWAWTGEFVGACTRLGKMPVLYQSHALPGGRERSSKYVGKTFHDDLSIKPIAAGRLASAYLDFIQQALHAFRDSQMGKLRQAAAWWRQTKADQATALVVGHLFPGHFQDPRAPQRIRFQPTKHDEPGKGQTDLGRFVLLIGYQLGPKELVARSAAEGFKLAYMTVGRADQAAGGGQVIYLEPGWPLSDGCVKVEGYDVAILPASGVVNAAIYWAMLAEVCRAD